MIRKLEVVGLNYQFDYGLKFNDDLNILTGLNGCGKTTLLKLMWYLISGNLHRIISEIPFEFVLIETDQFSLSIQALEGRRYREGALRLIYEFDNEEKRSEIIRQLGFSQRRTIISLNKKIASVSRQSLFFPTFRRIEGGYSRFSRHIDETGESEVVHLISSASRRLHQAMSQFSGQVSTHGHKFITSISTTDLEDLIPLKRTEIADKVNELYANLLIRLNSRIPSHQISNLKDANQRLTNIRADYAKVDAEKRKLRAPLIELDHFVNAVFPNRCLRITEDIILGKYSETKDVISSDKLSAGQQQMLSFLCYNAFSSDTMIFIDEPELSLHINWQRYLPRILLAQGTTNQFFIATHAPTIYANFPDKELNLSDRGEEEIE